MNPLCQTSGHLFEKNDIGQLTCLRCGAIAHGILNMEQGPTQYAVEIDHTMDAVWLRDLCQKAAQEHHTRASKATQRKALNENIDKYECFAKYAERFEHIRKEEAARITRNMGLTPKEES